MTHEEVLLVRLMVQKSDDHRPGCFSSPLNNVIFTILTGERRISEPSTVWFLK